MTLTPGGGPLGSRRSIQPLDPSDSFRSRARMARVGFTWMLLCGPFAMLIAWASLRFLGHLLDSGFADLSARDHAIGWGSTVLSLGYAGLMIRLSRRSVFWERYQRGVCGACGQGLERSADSRCPACGAPFDARLANHSDAPDVFDDPRFDQQREISFRDEDEERWRNDTGS